MKEVRYTALILAAGCGQRVGGYKPLWRIAGRVVVDRVIESAASVCSKIRVIGGFDFGTLKAHLDAFSDEKVELVENRDWKSGMFSSVQLGLNGINTPVFIHPVDIAGVGASVYQKLASAAARFRNDRVFRPAYQGRAGHPILLMPQVARAVQAARSDSNLRDVLKRTTPRRDIPVDEELILYDFDTPEEFQELEKRILGIY